MKSNGIKKAPGIMYFKDESEFPQVMRLSPFLTIHHNYKVYEDSVTAITDGMRVLRVCCQSISHSVEETEASKSSFQQSWCVR